MIDHFGCGMSDYQAAKAFYTKALTPIGFSVMIEVTPEQNNGVWACGFGKERPDFWIGSDGKTTPAMHLAFRAQTREAVDAFYKAALDAGGKDNGPPGIRERYHPNYYAAFVRDLDGHNIEVVCHQGEAQQSY